MYRQNNPFIGQVYEPDMGYGQMTPDMASMIMSLSNILPQQQNYPMLAGGLTSVLPNQRKELQDAMSEPNSQIVGAAPSKAGQGYVAPTTRIPQTPAEWEAYRQATERMKMQMNQQPQAPQQKVKKKMKVIKRTEYDNTGTPVDVFYDERGNRYDYDPNWDLEL